MAVRGRSLDQRADRGQHLGDAFGYRLAQHRDLAAGRVDQAEQHPDHGGLPGPVGSQEAVPVARPDVQVDLVHHEQVAVASGEAARLDHRWNLKCVRSVTRALAEFSSTAGVTAPVNRKTAWWNPALTIRSE